MDWIIYGYSPYGVTYMFLIQSYEADHQLAPY